MDILNNFDYTDAIKIAVQVLLVYLLKDKILDLIARILHGVNIPLDYLVQRLEKSQTSIIRLNYRQRVLNVVLVSVAFVMIFSEFETLKEIIDATSPTTPFPFLGYQITVGTFASASYITIATILGFIALEFIHIRVVLQGVLFNDNEPVTISPPKEKDLKISKARNYVAVSGFVFLFLLATLQGIIAVARYQQIPNTNKPLLDTALLAFYFSLGFLTPIIAAFALLSFDVLLALIAKFFITLLNFLKLFVAILYMAVEVVIQVTASPIEKLYEIIFGKKELKEGTLKAIADRVKPLENTSPVFLETRSSMYRLFHANRKYGSTLMFLSDSNQIHFSVPSVKCEVTESTTFEDIGIYIMRDFPKFNGKEVKFKYIDEEGVLHDISKEKKIVDFKQFTDTIIVESEDISTAVNS
jgi:hypothetical protein